MDDQNKKSVTRKKVVDLKAVEALLDSEEQGLPEADQFEPNEELIGTTSRIKEQRDLIQSRIEKMTLHRDRVTKHVYDKVQRDYQMQMDSILKLLNEKKELLKDELEKLYLSRQKQTMEMNRHKEILEEAQFRHFLEEFTEDQFKEVESFETEEIEKRQGVLGKINALIKMHEELAEVPLRAPTPQAPVQTPPPPPPQETRVLPPPARIEAFEKTPIPGDLPQEPDPSSYFEPAPKESSITKTEPQPEEASLELEVTEPKLTSQSIRDEDTGRTLLRKYDEESPSKDPESILDILEEPDLESSPQSLTPTPIQSVLSSSLLAPATNSYKLVFADNNEGETKIKEFTLKDNISIGRSPSNDLVLQAAKISRQHAAINKYKDQYLVIDLKSSNGVYVNGRKVDEHALEEGDEISIGGYRMTFQKA